METVYKCSCHCLEFKTMFECQEHERKYAMMGSNSVGKMFWRYPTDYNNATFICKIKLVTEDGVIADKLCVRHDDDDLSLSIYEFKTEHKDYFFNVELADYIPVEEVPETEIDKLRKIIEERNLTKVDLFLDEADSHAMEKIEISEVAL